MTEDPEHFDARADAVLAALPSAVGAMNDRTTPLRLILRIKTSWWVRPLSQLGLAWCWCRLPMDVDAFIAFLARGYRFEAS